MDIGVAGVSSVERIGQGGFGIDDAMRERFTREVRAIGRPSGLRTSSACTNAAPPAPAART